MTDERSNATDSAELYRAGREAMKRRDLEAAIQLFRDSLAPFPHFKTAELLGECLLLRDRAAEAAICLAAAVGLGNNAFRACHLLARALAALGDEVGAHEKATLALEMNPQYETARELVSQLESSPQVRAAQEREES